MSESENGQPASTETEERSGLLNEDWLATIVGLAILALALLGLIPKAVIW